MSFSLSSSGAAIAGPATGPAAFIIEVGGAAAGIVAADGAASAFTPPDHASSRLTARFSGRRGRPNGRPGASSTAASPSGATRRLQGRRADERSATGRI